MGIIDEELAKAFLDDPDNVDLSEATEITDKAAELLSKHEGELNLCACSRISEKAIETLASRNGDLSLGISSLSDTTVAALAAHDGRLKLPELEKVGGEHAAVLATHSSALQISGWSHLHPNELDENNYNQLATEGERLLAKKLHDSETAVDTEIRKINQQDIIDANMAKKFLDRSYLDGSGSDQIELSDKKVLSVEAAEIFAKMDGGPLHLEGLTEIPDTVADLLGKSSGWLQLGKSASLSASGWKSLSSHKGWLSLKLESLPDEAASALSQYQGDQIFLEELSEISDAGIKSLTKYGGMIDFGGKRKTSEVRKRFKSFSQEN
ncbi:MAG: hypothetical protein MK172_07270 [Verrucomicrobiales bacterium]|nr:hypothetical protein [Verrucomicrobiales bacterium]